MFDSLFQWRTKEEKVLRATIRAFTRVGHSLRRRVGGGNAEAEDAITQLRIAAEHVSAAMNLIRTVR